MNVRRRVSVRVPVSVSGPGHVRGNARNSVLNGSLAARLRSARGTKLERPPCEPQET